MLHSARKRLTYANVMATIAVFGVVAGGGAYAASKLKLKNNSVSTSKIRNGAVTGAKIRNGAVTGPKIADQSIDGAKLNPSLTASLKDSCPADMNRIANTVCIDKVASTTDETWTQAMDGCATENRRLPTEGELYLAYKAGLLSPGARYWTDTAYARAGPPVAVDDAVYIFGTDGSFNTDGTGVSIAHAACSTAPSDG